jgi:DNA-binding transcriptional LysR family regulator
MEWSLDGIEALAAIVDTGSFAGAAKALHKVPSAVSYQVRQLEDALGVELFDRSGHRAALTPAGVAVLDEGRFLLARARRLERLAHRLAEGWEARLQVVVDGALPTGPLLEALTRLGEEDVPTHVQLRTEYLSGVPRRFAELGADLMLTLVPPDDPLLDVVTLPPMEFVLVAAPSHPAAREPHLDLADLQRHLELSVHDSDERTVARDTNLIPGARVFYVGDFAAKKEGLARGLGLGWMPAPLVHAELAEGLLVELNSTRGSRRRFPLALAHRRDRPLGPAGARLAELLVQFLDP